MISIKEHVHNNFVFESIYFFKITERSTTLYDTQIMTIYHLQKNKRNMQGSKTFKKHGTVIAGTY